MCTNKYTYKNGEYVTTFLSYPIFLLNQPSLIFLADKRHKICHEICCSAHHLWPLLGFSGLLGSGFLVFSSRLIRSMP